MRIFISLYVLIVTLAFVVAVFTFPTSAQAAQVCIPFAQTEIQGVDSEFIHPCFDSSQVVRVKTIYSGKSGNLVEIILREGKWFYKNGLTKAQVQACIAGRGKCDKWQNVKLRDLTRGDVSIFKKNRRLHAPKSPRADRDIMACAGGSFLHCP